MFWQSHIIESFVDEDVDTDNEQMKIAGLHVLIELREAMQTLYENGWKALRNKPIIKN
jgi:hypothetical protein